MANKVYTADELRAESAELVDMLGEHNTAASMLRYAADLADAKDAEIAELKARIRWYDGIIEKWRKALEGANDEGK